jgi:hypothetical protein
MKRLAMILVFLAGCSPSNQHSLGVTAQNFVEQANRPCQFQPGGWVIVNCSNVASATSAQLREWSRYVMQCGDDSYIATGDEVTDTADANDGWISESDWLTFMTTDSIRYIACLNKNADSDCRLWECK